MKKERQLLIRIVRRYKKNNGPHEFIFIRQFIKFVFIMNTQEDAEETVKRNYFSCTEVSKNTYLGRLAMTISFSYKGGLSHLPSLLQQAQNAQKKLLLCSAKKNAISSYHDIGISPPKKILFFFC